MKNLFVVCYTLKKKRFIGNRLKWVSEHPETYGLIAETFERFPKKRAVSGGAGTFRLSLKNLLMVSGISE